MQEYNPEDLDIDINTMKMFLSQTAKELSNIDRNIISANPHLSPKRMEFEQTAHRILSTEIRNPQRRIEASKPNINNLQSHLMQPQTTNIVVPYVDTGEIKKIDNDPNQLEFKFDNSVTAIMINNKLVQLEKMILSIDKKLQKLIDYIDDSEDTE